MDGATLGIMVNKFATIEALREPINLFTIHDCFATTVIWFPL
jgi:hypothetical protein